VSPRVRAAIDAVRARDVHLVLVTGRRYPAARRIADMIGGEVDLVLHNGALVLERSAREEGLPTTADGLFIVQCVPLERATAVRAVEVGRALGADPVVHCGTRGEGRLVVEGVAQSNTLLAYYLDRSHPDVTSVADVCAFVQEDPLQVMYGGSLESMAALYPRLVEALGAAARIERTVYPASGVSLLDILHPSVGKAQALALVQRRFGASPAETLAIGDNWNDHEMLAAAGRGYVMGNAEPEMLALGLPVLPGNDDDGVAVALERDVLHA
jgi:hydroxymethylpyrimidine pyrophosphatase-like HAD family hydrolase